MRCLGKAVLTASCGIVISGSAFGQVFGNAVLSGKYFVRHIQVTVDLNNSPTDERSIVGSISFDGKGGYTFTGQQVVGSALPAAYTASGTYSVQPDGEMTLTNPQQPSLTVNARYGADAVVGASTEAGTETFDLFAAIPAPAATVTDSKATLAVSYNFADYELSLSPIQLGTGGGVLQFDGAGGVAMLSGQGHSTAVSGGLPQKQTPGGTYTVNADGTGTLAFQLPAGVAAGGAVFGTAVRSLAISANGNVVLAGTPGGHDILIGLRDAGSDNIVLPAAFSGRYWLASIQVNTSATPASQDLVGALSVISADSAAVISERVHSSAVPNHYPLTASTSYSLAKGGGALNAGNALLLPGKGGNFVGVDAGGSTVSPDANSYAIVFGVQIPAVSGSGVFLNPQGVINAAGNAPAGNPISPGEFITLYGSGLAAATVVTAPPYPAQAGGVSVSIGGLPAPVYLVRVRNKITFPYLNVLKYSGRDDRPIWNRATFY